MISLFDLPLLSLLYDLLDLRDLLLLISESFILDLEFADSFDIDRLCRRSRELLFFELDLLLYWCL